MTLNEFIELGGSVEALASELDRFFLDNNEEDSDGPITCLSCADQEEAYDVLTILGVHSVIGLGFCLEKFLDKEDWTDIYCSGQIHFGRDRGYDAVGLSYFFEKCLENNPGFQKGSHDIDVELPDFSELMEFFS